MSDNEVRDQIPSSRSDRDGLTVIFVNPHSGRGKSTSIYENELFPLLKSNEIEHQLVVSDRPKRISSYIQDLTPDQFSRLKSFVVVSGDGALHETINALMKHPDWQMAMDVPIGIIPTGSGNGLAYTLLRQKYPDLESKSEAIEICCKAALQSETCQADLVRVTFGEKSIVWSFLSIGWGLMADIDIDSEWLRRFGEFRFTVYGVLRSVTYAAYKGRLSFKPAKTDHSISQDASPDDLTERLRNESNSSSEMYGPSDQNFSASQDQHDWIHIEDTFSCLYAVSQSHVSSVTQFAPKSKLTDHLIYLTYVRGKLSPCQAVEFLLKIKDGSHETLPYTVVVPVTSFKFQPLERSKVVVDGEVIAWEQSDGPLTAEIASQSMRLLWS